MALTLLASHDPYPASPVLGLAGYPVSPASRYLVMTMIGFDSYSRVVAWTPYNNTAPRDSRESTAGNNCGNPSRIILLLCDETFHADKHKNASIHKERHFQFPVGNLSA